MQHKSILFGMFDGIIISTLFLFIPRHTDVLIEFDLVIISTGLSHCILELHVHVHWASILKIGNFYDSNILDLQGNFVKS